MCRLMWMLTGRVLGVAGLIVMGGVGSSLWCAPVSAVMVAGSMAMIWNEVL